MEFADDTLEIMMQRDIRTYPRRTNTQRRYKRPTRRSYHSTPHNEGADCHYESLVDACELPNKRIIPDAAQRRRQVLPSVDQAAARSRLCLIDLCNHLNLYTATQG